MDCQVLLEYLSMVKRGLVFLFLLLLLAGVSFAQKGAIKKGNKKTKRGEFNEAIAYYEKASKDPGLKGESNYYIAEAYRLSNRIDQALPYYAQAIRNKVDVPDAYLNYAYALKTQGAYSEAQNQIRKYLEIADSEDGKDIAEKELENLNRIAILSEKKNYYRVRNLELVNTEFAEYSPVYNNGELYFTSNRKNSKMYKATGTPFTDIFRAKTNGARVDVETLERLEDIINDVNVNEGSVTFSPDGRTMIFAKGNSGKKRGTLDVNLYITRFRNKQWTDPRMLPISDPEYWDSSPCFSADGRTLYFASNRPGGYGGTDIYTAKLDRRGRFSNVRNLGEEINTPGDEMFPYVSDDGKLYFSSTGHPGFGGLDMFVAKRSSGVIDIENLGAPMNSAKDDFGLFLYKPDRGFFSSNREGGAGDDDIYTFLNNDPNLKTVNYFLAGVTKTHDDNENQITLPNVKVQLLDFDGDVLDETTTDQDGKFNFRVYEYENYVLLGEKQGADAENYFVTRQNFTTIGKSIPQEELVELVTNITLDTLMFLDKIVIDKPIVLENIYYDFARWDITTLAAIELDKMVDILNDNPDIVIELSSHTDSVDTESYNLRLSQRRAESAVNYIVEAGVDRSRLIAKGYGESQPIARNTNPDGTDNPEGRARNRRTEFKVVRRDKTKLQNTDNPEDFDEDRFFKNSEDVNKGNNNQKR